MNAPTSKQENFAQLVVELGSLAEAYRRTYSSDSDSGFYVYALIDPRDGSAFYLLGIIGANHGKAN